jgi:UDP-N-acetylglucosamine 4,6-dehydratase
MTTLTGRNVLITGGTGSFGRAFVQRALAAGARRIVVFSRDELKQSQMAAAIPDASVRYFVGDVRNRDRLRLALKGCDTVIHAAAMKRIEVCEAEPSEAVATNIFGTENVALEAIAAGVERAVFLSTDKAPGAVTLYGMTKAVAERLWVRSNVYAAGGPTLLSATRYGNVLGSRGSVLELFRRQYHAGQPLTLTSEAMTRFWMTMHQAVGLVELALREMRGGEVFVSKVGSATVLDLARAVVGPALYAPGHVETGLRPGERLHETLISQDEARNTYDAGGHYIIEPEARTWGDVAPRDLPRVPDDFSYRSDTNDQQLSVEQLREMIAA